MNRISKLLNLHLNKVEKTVKNKTEATLRMSMKMFNGKSSSQELLFTTTQNNKLINVFENNTSTDIKLSQALNIWNNSMNIFE